MDFCVNISEVLTVLIKILIQDLNCIKLEIKLNHLNAKFNSVLRKDGVTSDYLGSGV